LIRIMRRAPTRHCISGAQHFQEYSSCAGALGIPQERCQLMLAQGKLDSFGALVVTGAIRRQSRCLRERKLHVGVS
jgi:hypothetical protein